MLASLPTVDGCRTYAVGKTELLLRDGFFDVLEDSFEHSASLVSNVFGLPHSCIPRKHGQGDLFGDGDWGIIRHRNSSLLCCWPIISRVDCKGVA